MTDYLTREDWLNAFIDAARPVFEAVNAPLPLNVRVAVGFTSKGARGSRVGEIWSSDNSEDGHYEIFIRPSLEGKLPICKVLTRELIHAAVGIKAGLRGPYHRVGVALGLSGRMSSPDFMADWFAWALPIMERLGPIPYGTLDDKAGISSGRNKQDAYLLKAECTCGFVARVTRKHVEPHSHLNCPVPDCMGVLAVQGY